MWQLAGSVLLATSVVAGKLWRLMICTPLASCIPLASLWQWVIDVVVSVAVGELCRRGQAVYRW
jgi:hypothetical protein